MENIILNITPATIIKYSVFILAILILFIMNLSNKARIKRLNSRYVKFMSGLGDQNIEQLLENCMEGIDKLNEKTKLMENHINDIERNVMLCIQKVGIVRFNAFENVGSDLSFAIALLNNSDNGVVISGIYSRESSFTYAKPIAGGKSRYPLSAEEIQALDIAKKSGRERVYND